MKIRLSIDLLHPLAPEGTCGVFAESEGRPKVHVMNAMPSWWKSNKNKRTVAGAVLAGVRLFAETCYEANRKVSVSW